MSRVLLKNFVVAMLAIGIYWLIVSEPIDPGDWRGFGPGEDPPADPPPAALPRLEPEIENAMRENAA